ncbi:hypothetical protein FRC15_008867 [Serendipita sp. 397]|nr:hypothetical protein FRC15_008867 [Serendipita sp. 397]
MASVLIPAAYLAVLVIALLIFGRIYRKREAASRRLEPWFPAHHERDVYVSLLQCNPPAHDGLIKAALVRRAVADVHRIFRLREDKVALSNLLQRGSISDDLWTSFLAAEKELEAEILEVVTEAETFKQGWGNLIFQTAAEIVQNEKLREGMNKVFHSRPQLEAKYGVTKRIVPTITINAPPNMNGAAPTTPTTTVSSKTLQQSLPVPAPSTKSEPTVVSPPPATSAVPGSGKKSKKRNSGRSMAPLTHPSIKDGWFREISPQWPGQAMTLKVKRILHVEKSLYQDVLVFESETYGNVLILDGVIQCTERDEFSYQEMIAHLPLASHPNPKKVLVIGGGDGGVVREVLRHESVEEVVLCDIDEAVIRVSKQYLPHMSELLDSSRVRVFVGDGFKFLAENTSTYDVIITDSSDPVGPAESLFQKPYFQLLHDALAPGGTISTQGECLWIHLPLIKNTNTMVKEIFPNVEYAFTTIPTYPSGQIGFCIASKDAERDLRTPLRKVSPTRYYNEDVHRAAFVLPEFGKRALETGEMILPVLGGVAPSDVQSKKILLLGSGFVARPCAEYVARNPANSLTIACRTLASSVKLGEAEFPSASEKARIVSGLRWIGLLSSTEKVTVRGSNLLDTLCARLETLMAYEEGERDLVMLQHKFTVEWTKEDGSVDEEVITSTLEMYGTPGGHSAMAVTVGVPCGIATQLVLDGVINQTGVLAPYSKELCDPLIELLEKEGLGMVEARI